MQEWGLMNFSHVASKTDKRGNFIKMREITFIEYKRNNM